MQWTLALLVAGTLAGFVARPYAAKRYHQWRARRHAAEAAEYFAQHDVERAMVSARTALTHSPRDPEATRIMAEAAEALGAPEAEEWRARLDEVLPGDAENALARATAALKAGNPGAAEQFVKALDPAARNSAAYHVAAAGIAMEKRDAASAEAHFAEAARLEPGQNRHRLNLAGVRLQSKAPGARDAGLAALQEMRGSPATAVEALRLLLGDAVRRREATGARDLADALVAEKRCTFGDKLSRLTTLRQIHDERATAYLLELRDAAVSDPAELYSLLAWMNGNDLSLMVSEWGRWMPPELAARPPVCLGVAEAYLRASEWQKLADLVSGAKWGEMDFLRRAFLGRAQAALGEEEDAAKEWSDAVSIARGRGDALERLAKFALQMKWNQRAEEIMWMLAARPQGPRWVVDSLWKDAFRRGETARLQKLSGVIFQADPKGLGARNNYAFISLLTRNEEGNPHRIAEELHREFPDNALVASTYALSLFQQGRAGEAAAVMAAQKPGDLRQPQIALYCAIFLLGDGQPEKAGQYLKLSADWPMLPEEKSLLERVKAASLKKPEAAADPLRGGDAH